jgi:hypothetical protein
MFWNFLTRLPKKCYTIAMRLVEDRIRYAYFRYTKRKEEFKMSDVASYLSKHKSDIKKTIPSGPKGLDNDNTLLTIVILSATDTHILIGHLGRKFSLRQDDIVEITDAPENVPNMFGYGRTARVVVRKTATLMYEQSVAVADLELGQPFAMARPTTVPIVYPEPYTPNEAAWRQINQVPASNYSPFVTACNPNSPTASSTNCQYAFDDSGFDDGQGDGQRLDD